jgi:hypothetical protein
MPQVHFVCRSCGQDYSDFVNDLIRKEQGTPAAAPASSATPPPQSPPSAPPPQTALRIAASGDARPTDVASAAPSAPAAPVPPAAPRLRISRAEEPAAAAAAPASSEQAPASKYCSRHRTELATDHCQVCQKPICPKCLDSFGPYCSPFCRNKVEGARMDAPAFGGQRFVAQRRFWRKAGLISGVAGVILVCAFGFWFWYVWIGSMPGVWLSVRYDGISHSGSSRVVGADQLVFLHGGTLARYDLKTKQKIWSLDLVTPEQVQAVLKQEDEESTEMQHRYGHASPEELQPQNIREKNARIDLEQQYALHGSGQNVWIVQGNVLTHYDWNSGNVLQQVTLTNNFGDFTDHGDELLAVGQADNGAQTVTHVSMDDGSIHTEEFSGTAGATANPALAQNARPVTAPAEGGLPLSANGQGRPLNPGRVQEQVQNMSYPARLALPALLGNSEHNQQINQEISDEDRESRPRPAQRPAAAAAAAQQAALDAQSFTLIPDGDSYVAFGSKLMQENIVQREAMKAPPQHSALDSANLSAANENAAVNEQLNDIQRQNGGDKVTEDVSTYQVALRRPGSTEPDWIGEIVGPPQFFPLTDVNVLAAGKSIMVFDKSNKRLWQDNLTYDITGGDGQFYQSQFGQGPCVENNGTLYVFDQAVLTAYDPSSGNVHWRIPSVGVVGLFFDDKGMVYINTTTGNPDDIKYSRQIDVDKQTQAVVMKVDPANGNILWKATDGGFISYLSGKFIYAFRSYDAGDPDEQYSDATAGLTAPSYLKIIRINPANGRVMWEHDEDRAPVLMGVGVQFDRNTISIVLKKEVEVLHFFIF